MNTLTEALLSSPYYGGVLISISILVVLFVLLSYLLDHKHFLVLLQDLRIPRIFHYLLMMGIGIAIVRRDQPEVFFEQIRIYHGARYPYLWIFLIPVSTALAAIFAIVTNNIEDLEIDKISNPDRPLVIGSVSKKAYLHRGVIALIISILVALCVHPYFAAGILGVTLGYLIYSLPPLKLKRVPILAKEIIGLNSLFFVLSGFLLSGAELTSFPIIQLAFIMGPLALSSNFIDLKDLEGDKAAGIKTLPGLMGLKRSRILIAIFTVSTYIMAFVILGKLWTLILIIPQGVLHLALLFKTPYREKWVFVAYLNAIIGYIVLLCLCPA